MGLSLLIVLSGCVKQAPPGKTLAFDICPRALATLPKRGAFQGYDGWFYFKDDLIKPKLNLQELIA